VLTRAGGCKPQENDHFENLQSTNWNTVRFKPPPPADKNPLGIKWRVEFRPMEVGLSDFENSAFAVFIILLARAIREQALDLYMPLSLVDANMAKSHERDAATNEFFWFRTAHTHASHTGVAELSLDEILNGRAATGVVGLLERARTVLDAEGCSGEERQRLETYLDFIGQRAAGALKTPAAWIREFVTSHPEYKADSVVSEAICHDLMRRCAEIASSAGAPAPDLLPHVRPASPTYPETQATLGVYAASPARPTPPASRVASPVPSAGEGEDQGEDAGTACARSAGACSAEVEKGAEQAACSLLRERGACMVPCVMAGALSCLSPRRSAEVQRTAYACCC
jgi:hypothetical protein